MKRVNWCSVLSMVSLGLLSASFAAACGDGKASSETGGGSAGGAPAGGTPGSSGAPGSGGDPCTLDHATCDGQAVIDCQNGQPTQIDFCDDHTFCDQSLGDAACNCVVGTARCIDGDTAHVQVCEPKSGAKNEFETHECDKGEVCVDGVGCPACHCDCTQGQIKCGDDGDTVFVCQPDNSGLSCGGNCGVFKPNQKCTETGFIKCVTPAPGEPASEVADFCLNACNKAGAPIMGELCADDPDLLCATLICNETKTALIPDHIQCHSGGTPCAVNEECASCHCKDGLCLGSEAGLCSGAESQCPAN